ncbi:hypothetical protein [Legionella qingyii]|uniref:hypothetical protein n=1 Tax=Legionella qingyii TaxID=2184757 RepID=UPI001F382521|nr:hypothetical protein [Legionella qingyii]
MKYINELSRILNQRLNWQKSRIGCFAQMLLALFVVRGVNLSEIAMAINGDKARLESRYKLSTEPNYKIKIKLFAKLTNGILFAQRDCLLKNPTQRNK